MKTVMLKIGYTYIAFPLDEAGEAGEVLAFLASGVYVNYQCIPEKSKLDLALELVEAPDEVQALQTKLEEAWGVNEYWRRKRDEVVVERNALQAKLDELG